MSGQELPIYRLPIPTASRVGQVRVVTDRNGRHYVNGSRLVAATPSGDFQILELESGESVYVKTTDFARLPKARPRKR
jgi:hypothetical protein